MCSVRGTAFGLNQGPWSVSVTLCYLDNTIETEVCRKMVDTANKTKGLRRYSDAIFTLVLSHSKSCLPGNHFFNAIFQHIFHSVTPHHYTHYTEMKN